MQKFKFNHEAELINESLGYTEEQWNATEEKCRKIVRESITEGGTLCTSKGVEQVINCDDRGDEKIVTAFMTGMLFGRLIAANATPVHEMLRVLADD